MFIKTQIDIETDNYTIREEEEERRKKKKTLKIYLRNVCD